MKIIETDLPGCLVIEPQVFGDARGFFFESFNTEKLAPHGLHPKFVQGNVSSSSRGVLRGLHYQWPNPQGKYVSVIEGEVWDVAVDIRRGSPTFGKWAAAVLSAENKRHFWIPEGFAHGFVTLSERAVFTYLCTATYDAKADAGRALGRSSLGDRLAGECTAVVGQGRPRTAACGRRRRAPADLHRLR